MTRLEKKQQILADMVRMICRKKHVGLFVSGFGGAGKSYIMSKICEEEGEELVVFNSHATPLALYRIIYEYRNSEAIILFDDADALYQNKPALGLLRSCLFGHPDRVVTWSSSSLPDDLPPRLTTTSRFMFAANQVPKTCPIFDAMVTRCLTYRLDVSNSEICEQFRAMSANGWPGCDARESGMLIDYLESSSDNRQLSMRLLAPVVRIYTYSKEQGTDWRPLVDAQLHSLAKPTVASTRISKQEREERIVREGLELFPDSPTEQVDYFKEKAGKSQATYYRLLKRIREEF